MIFAPRFNALGVPWAATGSIASMIYGEVRTTQDIDVIILLHSRAIVLLEKVFSEEEFIDRRGTSLKSSAPVSDAATLILSTSRVGLRRTFI